MKPNGKDFPMAAFCHGAITLLSQRLQEALENPGEGRLLELMVAKEYLDMVLKATFHDHKIKQEVVDLRAQAMWDQYVEKAREGYA